LSKGSSKSSSLLLVMSLGASDGEKEAAVIMAGSCKIYLLDLVELKSEVNTKGSFILYFLH